MSYNYNKKENGKNDTGRPEKFHDPREMEKKGMKYIDDCRASKKPITVTGLCLCLETTRDTLMEYQRKEEFSDTIKRLKLYAENYAEEYLYNPNGRAVVGAIFALKNFGWSDKLQIETQTTAGALTPEERAAAQERIRNFSER
ncbi:MAG: terminase small subunit [Parcubacteria group bacterium]|jgi:hypothetical protein